MRWDRQRLQAPACHRLSSDGAPGHRAPSDAEARDGAPGHALTGHADGAAQALGVVGPWGKPDASESRSRLLGTQGNQPLTQKSRGRKRNQRTWMVYKGVFRETLLVRLVGNEKWNEPFGNFRLKETIKGHSISHSLLSTSKKPNTWFQFPVHGTHQKV